MRRVKKIVLFILLTISFLNANSSWNEILCGFPDVSWDNKYCLEINKLKQDGIVKGKINKDTGINEFDPKGDITRAELLKVVIKTKSKYILVQDCIIKPFNDVPTEHWGCGYIRSAKYFNNIVKGYSENGKYLFKPENKITIAEALKIILKSFTLIDSHDMQEQIHVDNFDENYRNTQYGDSWSDTYIKWVKEHHISFFNKNITETFLKQHIKREEVMSIYKEINDAIMCKIPEGYEKNLINHNPEYYSNYNKPTCYEKSLYFTYLKFGSTILNEDSQMIKGNMKQIQDAHRIIDILLTLMESAFTKPISTEDSCSDLTDKFDLGIKTLENAGALGNVDAKILTLVNDTYMHYCQIRKFGKLNLFIQPKQAQLIIKGLFDSFNIVNDLIGAYSLNQQTIRMKNIIIARLFLEEYYSYGGNMAKLAEEYGTIINLETLIKEIATENHYVVKQDPHWWEANFDIFLTKKYIESIMTIIQNHYKEMWK